MGTIEAKDLFFHGDLEVGDVGRDERPLFFRTTDLCRSQV
jgi:hypothetical protein